MDSHRVATIAPFLLICWSILFCVTYILLFGTSKLGDEHVNYCDYVIDSGSRENKVAIC